MIPAYEKEMRRRSLYKYYSERKWAEEFLGGKLLFRSLAYFRDYEDQNVREDQNEGTALFRPEGGLIVNNLTQGKTLTLPDHAFVSGANQEEIFVFCTSRSDTDELRRRFKAVMCVERTLERSVRESRQRCRRQPGFPRGRAGQPGLDGGWSITGRPKAASPAGRCLR